MSGVNISPSYIVRPATLRLVYHKLIDFEGPNANW